MKYAVVEGERREAEPGLSGHCPCCEAVTISKCGPQRIWHWAHWGTRTCDPWWENETDWHRAWKNHFPKECQEVIHHSDSGEKHIADVKTQTGVAIEFQHSFLRQDERESREVFYRNMVWVVDGRRRVRDRSQFFASLDAAVVVNRQPLIILLPSNRCALLRDWEHSRVPVYFDFGGSEPEDILRFDTPTLWRLNPCGPNGAAYLTAVPKALFLHIHLNGEPFEQVCTAAIERAAAHNLIQSRQPRPLVEFERHMAWRQMARRRRRF